MGTRARIAMKNDDNTYTSIYTHWDGYPSHHGPILLEHYTTPAQVRKLMKLGSLSTLAEKIGTKHPFDKAPDDECNAYGRDRGETDTEAKKSVNLAALSALTQDSGGEYLYVFEDGEWYVAKGGVAFFGFPASKEPGALRPLRETLAEEKSAR